MEERREFLKVVREEKRNYRRKQINSVELDRDIYKIIH